ncbi:MAG: hypothetical protein QXP01_07345, partial [Candidatus Hadarchaeum sp.]
MHKGVLGQPWTLPDPRYLEFCGRYLLRAGSSQVDPFSIMIPDTYLSKAYIYRAEDDIVRAVLESLSPVTFIMAPYGRGKTTFMRVARIANLPEQVLVVPLPIASAIGRLLDRAPGDSSAEQRFRQTLLCSIFGAFWDLLRRPE